MIWRRTQNPEVGEGQPHALERPEELQDMLNDLELETSLYCSCLAS